MVTVLLLNIFRHQKSAIMVHFVIEGKNITEKNGNFLITHVFRTVFFFLYNFNFMHTLPLLARLI